MKGKFDIKKVGPVGTMDSVEALDLLNSMRKLIKKHIHITKTEDLDLMDRVKESILVHRRALVNVIGKEEI